MSNIEDTTETRYQESLSFLFAQLPMFSRVGAAAYKPGLDTSIQLDEYFGNPHKEFKSIHVAGTNGKGSTSHTIAAALQAQGYKVGLYTSPHLVDFRERMRVNGEMIPKEKVTEFVDRWKECDYPGHPSFFELTMIMAFRWFADMKVDYAVIEVGMGGRLDSTNIISPIFSVITNISFDHTQFLGDTLPKIASEKAGIMKPGITCVIGEAEGDVERVFVENARKVGAPLILAYKDGGIVTYEENKEGGWTCHNPEIGGFTYPLGGDYQKKNINTALNALLQLRKEGIVISDDAIKTGMRDVDRLTGLAGRWTIISKSPLTICDTGHNEAGLKYNLEKLERIVTDQKKQYGEDSRLRFVIGFVADKAIDEILPMFPEDSVYYVTNAAIPRAMKAETLAGHLNKAGLTYKAVIPSVAEAVKQAMAESSSGDVVYIGGSTFVVADYLASRCDL